MSGVLPPTQTNGSSFGKPVRVRAIWGGRAIQKNTVRVKNRTVEKRLWLHNAQYVFVCGEISVRKDFYRRPRWGCVLQRAQSLSDPLVLSISLDCKNVSLFFNQWKLNYPDSWATLEYINIFWQAWLRSSPPTNSRTPAEASVSYYSLILNRLISFSSRPNIALSALGFLSLSLLCAFFFSYD